MRNGLLHVRRKQMVVDLLRRTSATHTAAILGISKSTAYSYFSESNNDCFDDWVAYHNRNANENLDWLKTECKALAALASYYEREQRKWEAGKRR